MRLHRLSLCGIGPFAGEHAIDFGRFEDSGLFLLEGPTGSGKSTVVDALTFALYNDVARGRDASKDRLRSAFAGRDDPSFVELVFEVSAGVFRVRRTPAYTKPGNRQPTAATVKLERVVLDDSGAVAATEPLSSRVGEADEELAHLVGLTKEQFLQTVVLPQGKFAAFLDASSEERQGLLQDIFDTGLYEVVQREFRERARAADRDLEDARSGLVAAAGALARTLGEGAPDLAGQVRDGDADATLGGAAAGVERIDATLRAARADAAAAEADEERSRRELEAARREAEAIRRRAELAQRRRRIEARRADLDAQARVLDAARRASACTAALRRARHAGDSLREAQEAARSAMSRARAQGVAVVDAAGASVADVRAADRAALEAQRRALGEQRGGLRELVDVERGLPDRRDALREARARLAADLRARDALRDRVRDLPREQREARRRIDQLAAAGAPAGGLRERVATLEQKARAADRTDMLQADLVGLGREWKRAERAAQAAHAAEEQVRRRWLSSSAALLAADLREGEPCPVCGSTAHPAPAAPVEGQASLAQVEAARTAGQAADAVLDRARGRHREAAANLSALLQSLGAAPQAIRDDLESARGALGRAARAESDLGRAREGLEDLRRRTDQEQQTLREAEVACATRATQLERDGRELDRDAGRCRQAAGEAGTAERADRRLADRERAASELAAAADHLAAGEAELREAEDERDRQLRAQGFPAGAAGGESVRQASRTAAEQRALEGAIADYRAEASRVEGALAAPEIRAAEGREAPDVAAAEARHAHARERAVAARTEVGHREQASRAAASQLAELRRRTADLRARDGRARPLRRLARLANASGPENLEQTPLAAFVLMSRFEEVLAAANPRLLAVSAGRYELRRTDREDGRARKGGLGLVVVDHETEVPRSPRTLSGGESFYTSLALALGLADVVTAEAGGVELGTMFVDEGFGSLDSEALDLVMDQLGELRRGGRVVGVISHVDEMRARIADRISVRRVGPGRGSTLRVLA